MIVGARCQEDLGACNSEDWGSTVITLYGCSFIRVSFLDVHAFIILLMHTCP